MKILAAIMIAAGVLIAGLSGLCTAAFGLSSLFSIFSRAGLGAGILLIVALVIGTPFIAGGVALFRGGLALWKRHSRDQGGGGPA
jgi:hypothetical protein